MTTLLSLNIPDITMARAVMGEVTRFHFNGGSAPPQFNINMTEAFVEDQIYTFSGEVESIDSGGIHGICYGGGSTDLIDSVGPFSLSLTPDEAAYGQTTFVMRGISGTVAVIINPTLVLAE